MDDVVVVGVRHREGGVVGVGDGGVGWESEERGEEVMGEWMKVIC
jgi:hypothetical protein